VSTTEALRQGRFPPGPAQACAPVSFVVIAYNEAPNIERCIRSVLSQRGAPVLEVVVVDDASTDETPAIVAGLSREDRRVKLVRLATNGGRGNARATGVDNTSGQFVAMVDGDIVLPPDWLERCFASLQGCDAAGGKAVPDGDVAYLCRTFGLSPRGRPSTMTLTGNNALFRREVFDRVGFDRDLSEGEDIALNHAMARAGLRSSLVPCLTVDHCESKSFSQSLRWLYQSGKGGARQLERYRHVRLPDLAFGGFLASLGAGGGLALASRAKRFAVGLPLTWLLAVATGHMLACFRPSRGSAWRFVAATLVDALMVGSYSAGRLAGHFFRRLGT
jgi:GT2 family glycosyltransferase